MVEVVKWFKRVGTYIKEAPATPQPDQLTSFVPTEAYMAYTSGSGIPALTGAGGEGDQPGVAECAIYKCLPTGESGGIVTMERIKNLAKHVYNFHDFAIPAGIWTAVVKDKFGRWIALPFFATVDCDSGTAT